MKITKSRLGRGLSSLISVSDLPVETEVAPSTATANSGANGEVARQHQSPTGDRGRSPNGVPAILVPVQAVEPNPNQPRRQFDETAIASLAASLKSAGLIQPIVVRQLSVTPIGGAADTPARYQLIAGERRWRAAKLAGLESIPAIVRQADDSTQAQLALIENIHRQDLNPIDRAMGYRSLIDQLGVTQVELAERLSEDRSGIANHLRLLELAEPVRQLIAEGRLSLGHGKLLAGIADMLEQARLAQAAVAQEMSVRALERAIEARAGTTPAAPPPAAPAASAHLQDLERSMARQLGMKVQLRAAAKKGKGRLIIHYATLDQFDDLMARLGVKAD